MGCAGKTSCLCDIWTRGPFRPWRQNQRIAWSLRRPPCLQKPCVGCHASWRVRKNFCYHAVQICSYGKSVGQRLSGLAVEKLVEHGAEGMVFLKPFLIGHSDLRDVGFDLLEVSWLWLVVFVHALRKRVKISCEADLSFFSRTRLASSVTLQSSTISSTVHWLSCTKSGKGWTGVCGQKPTSPESGSPDLVSLSLPYLWRG